MNKDVKLLLEKKRYYVYKVISSERNYNSNPVKIIDTICRIGDEKQVSYSREKLEEKFDELIENEVESCLEFLDKVKIGYVAPLKFDKGVFKWGKPEENYQNKPIFTEEELKTLKELDRVPFLTSQQSQSGHSPSALLDETKLEDIPEVFQEQVLKEIERDKPKVRKSSNEEILLEMGTLKGTTAKDDFKNVLLSPETKGIIKTGITKIKLRKFLDENWNLGSIEPQQGKNIMNFYGPAGTGKTLSAKAVAHSIGKKLLQVDYSQVESKFVGDTSKNVKKVFDLAKQHDAIILFDEADSLVSRRVGTDEQRAGEINQNRNVFMQELDGFDGIVILTTNLFENYDPAILRRINQHVEFKKPTVDIREQLIRQHIPSEVPLSENVNFAELAKLTDGFSGGDIKNMIYEAMVGSISLAEESGLPLEQVKLTQEQLIVEINKIKNTQQNYGGVAKTISLI